MAQTPPKLAPTPFSEEVQHKVLAYKGPVDTATKNGCTKFVFA